LPIPRGRPRWHGYVPAPLPPGALEVGGLYLTPTSRAFQAGCQRVADRLGFVIPCPQLLPASAPGTAPKGLCEQPSTCLPGQALRFTQEAFLVPFGYAGAPGGYGLLQILAAPSGGQRGQPGLQCHNERQIAMLTVQRTWWAALTICSDDPQGSLFGRSVLLRWSQQGTLVVVMILGHEEANQRLVVALADHLQLVSPRS